MKKRKMIFKILFFFYMTVSLGFLISFKRFGPFSKLEVIEYIEFHRYSNSSINLDIKIKYSSN